MAIVRRLAEQKHRALGVAEPFVPIPPFFLGETASVLEVSPTGVVRSERKAQAMLQRNAWVESLEHQVHVLDARMDSGLGIVQVLEAELERGRRQQLEQTLRADPALSALGSKPLSWYAWATMSLQSSS